MEAKELRLGNWVNETKYGEIQISIDNFYNELEFGYYIKDIMQPIPLTEEWLVKFGFEIEKYKSIGCIESPHNMFYSLEKRGEYYYPYETDNVIQFELKYVHQLQNLYFALTGEELTIL